MRGRSLLRAVLLGHEPWSLRTVRDWPEPVLGPGQVLVRISGVGICGSDLALADGRRRVPGYPWVPGHEAFGEVVATADGADRGLAGRRVVIEPNYPCLHCPACQAGQTSLCPDRAVVGFTVPGLLADYAAVPEAYAWPLPDNWTEGDAVCAEPLTVALAAIRRRGDLAPGSRCLVIGAGSQGMLMCLALVARGINPHVLEPAEGRRDLAVSLGAIAAAAGDDGFGTVFETSGSPAALAEALTRAAPGATIMLIGLSGQPALTDTELIVRRQLSLRGSIIYDHPGDFAATLRIAGVPAGAVLRASYPLEEAAAAFRAAGTLAGKTWIRLGH
ncbi:MAG TPA: alcohol dehydrogenase catalytic domain-containing protein [Trebonia sp.]|nr:alcohol dehydrogenase catalytic domain-containing protein [Trebonia sp.]